MRSFCSLLWELLEFGCEILCMGEEEQVATIAWRAGGGSLHTLFTGETSSLRRAHEFSTLILSWSSF
jgi:hypothetical protein